MSEVLERLHQRGERKCPRLRVRCANCGRIYVTSIWPKAAEARRACAACTHVWRRTHS
jgi:hypothetical protein